MSVYECEKEEVDRLVKVQSILNGMNDDGARLASELSGFINSVSSGESCDRESVLGLMSRIIRYLAGKSDNLEIAKSLLDITRLSADLRDVIEEVGISHYLGRVAAQHPEDYTSCNMVFVSDLIYNYHLDQSIKCLEKDGLKAVVGYLVGYPLFNTDKGKYHRRSIIHYLLHFELPNLNDEELSYLYAELESDATIKKMLDKYSARK